MARTADVVVIGGGINGCCTAYSLAKRGVKKVVLVEKGHIASGPTGRSSGIVRQHYSQEVLALMARDSVEVWKNFDQIVGGDAGFVQCGAVFFGPEDYQEALKKTAAMMKRVGIRTVLLSAADMVRMEPQLFADDIACGTYEPDGGYADPALAANSFAEAAQSEGVEIVKRTTVTGLRIQNEAIKGVMTDRGDISADQVVNVAGPWGARVAAMAGIEIPIVPSTHAVITLRRPPHWTSNTPVWADMVTGWYFKPEKTTGIMVGSLADIHNPEPRAIEDLSTAPSYEDTEQYSAAAVRRFPIMEEGVAQGGWVGIYDVTPDWQPVIDQMPGIKGFYSAVGFSGHGFKIGPAVGRAVSELVLDGKCSTYDLGVFRYNRFERKESSRGSYAFGIVG